MDAGKSLKQILQNAGALRSLQGSLLSASNGQSVRSLLITSGRDQEGKSTVSAAVAAVLADQGAKVLLTEGNFRSPELADLFDLPVSPGFQEFLTGSVGKEVIRQTVQPRLFVLPAGEDGSLTELMSCFPERFETLCRQFDYVVIDGDSVLVSSEVALFAQHVDGVILVTECEQTKWEVLTLCREKLSQLGAQVLGVILNKRQYYIPGGVYEKV
jgi:capsular exopolysaccharide synthesis family protein